MNKLTMKHRHHTPSNQAGFTLIELLLYVAIMAVVIGGISFFLILALGSRIKNQAADEVEGQGVFVMNSIGQSVKNASTSSPAGPVCAPAASASASSLSLTTADCSSTANITVFNVASVSGTNAITIKEGNNVALPLTSPAINVTNLTFSYLSDGAFSRLVKVTFTLSYKNNSGRDEYNYAKTFYDSFALR